MCISNTEPNRLKTYTKHTYNKIGRYTNVNEIGFYLFPCVRYNGTHQNFHFLIKIGSNTASHYNKNYTTHCR